MGVYSFTVMEGKRIYDQQPGCQWLMGSLQGNVKVGAKSLVLVVSGTSKSEIRISKLETISNFEYQMTKTFQTFIQYLRGSSRFGFWSFVFVSDFVLHASNLWKIA